MENIQVIQAIQVIKNNGSKENLNIDKIYFHLNFACEGLNVSQIEIIKHAKLKFYNGIKSSSIQDSLIQSCVELISEEEPDYNLAAGRLLNQKIRKEAYGSYTPKSFKDSVKNRIQKGFYSKDLLNYTDEELDLIGSKINWKLDENFEYSALRQLHSKYLLKHNSKVIETPQEIFALIPMAIFYKNKNLDLILQGYELLSTRKISLPTPIMNGARTPYKHFISCNLINAGDSVKSLARTAEAIMRCTANKSGLGVNLSHIRGIGASVGNPERLKHTGILPLIKTYETATASLTQTSRGGSTNLTMPFFHYEIELFSQLSDSKGTVETRARHTDQTIILNAWFLKKALSHEDIYLFHINEVPKLYEVLGTDEFDAVYSEYAQKVPKKHKKLVNAWNLLELFIYERIITGRLYFTFADNSKNGSFKENLYFTNLCTEIFVPSKPLDTETPEIGVCILGNVNLGYAELPDIPKCANFLVNFLDEMITISDYNLSEIKFASEKRRTLGIGIGNLFGALAKNKLFYNTKDARAWIHEIMEAFSFNLHKASIELAKIKGPCELISDTIYADGKFPFERFSNNTFTNFPLKCDWENLRNDLKKYGIRNSSLMAVPPGGNSSEVSNSTNGIEPPRYLVTTKTDKNMSYKKLVPFYKRFKNYYTTAWSQEFNNIEYFKLVSNIQKFVDQGISLNQYTNTLQTGKIEIADILNELIFAISHGIKTWYYENFRSLNDADGLNENQTQNCGSGGCAV